MSYPATVQTLQRIKNKGGRPRKSIPSAPVRPGGVAATAQDDDGDADDDAARQTRGVDRGIGGVEVGFGQEGSARVAKRGEGWGWEFVAENKDGLKLGLGKGTMVFPPIRELSLIAVSEKPSTAQSLEYVRQICDKYEHLGLDELITAQLDSDALAEERGYDPFVGKRMVWARNGHAKLARNVVFFPGGELGDELYVGSLLGDSSKTIKNTPLTRFLVGSQPVERFPTAILQIVQSRLMSPLREEQHATALIIRLHSSLAIYRATPDPSYLPAHLLAGSASPPLKLVKIGEIRTKDLAGRRAMDVVMDPTEWGRAAVVDESGGVWVWGWRRVTGVQRGESGMVLTNIRAGMGERDGFYRIAYGTRQGTLLVISSSEAVIIDIDDPTYPSTVLLTLDSHRQFAALDTTASARQAAYTCLVTSREVVWIDETRPGPPVLSWKHDFSEGGLRDLEITHVGQNDHDCFILSSRSNSTLLVFHLSTHAPLHFLQTPYIVSLDVGSRLKPLTDLVILDRQIETPDGEEEGLTVLGLAADGGVWSAPLDPVGADDDDDDARAGLKVVWDPELQVRAAKGPIEAGRGDKAGMDDKGVTRYTIMDARWAWLAINKEIIPDEDNPIFTADEFSQYIREIDAPFDHFVTAAELARDSVLAEGEPRRSHILRPLPAPPLDPTEVARLSTLNLGRDLTLVSHSPIPSSSIDGHLDDSTSLTDLASIRQTLDTAFPVRGDMPRARHTRCLDALALDLALSAAVLSSEALPDMAVEEPVVGDTDDDVLARAAGLTLSDTGPPSTKFAVLHPRPPNTAADGQDEDDEDEDETANTPQPRSEDIQHPTVRSLLAEWPSSSSVSDYTWKPWLESDTQPHSTLPNQSLTAPTPSLRPSQVRPIRPLPNSRPGSPRHPPSPNPHSNSHTTFFSQPPSSNRYAPPVVQTQPQPQAQGLPWSQPLRKKGSVPFIVPSGFGPRGSSPAPGEDGSSQKEGERESQEGMAATQVERGPFGGRQGGEKKKKVKKRVGGF